MKIMLDDFFENFKIAFKIALFIFAMTIGMVFLLAGARTALAATLRNEGILMDEYIHLGDIFDGVKNADYVLGPAPQPGKEMILNARTLYKIASSLDVDWQPTSSTEQIILKREAVIIPSSEIERTMEEKIKTSGVDENFSIKFNNTLSDIVLPGKEKETFDITDFSFDSQKDSFNALIMAPSSKNPLKRIIISGRIERLIPVPVFKSALRNGDIISANDLDWIDMEKSKVSASTLLDENDIINLTPRRNTQAGRPLQKNDLEQPKMVGRGDSVTLVFESGPMVLTTKGKALQDGAIGDTVRVSNSDSNKNLQGIVTAHREITIR